MRIRVSNIDKYVMVALAFMPLIIGGLNALSNIGDKKAETPTISYNYSYGTNDIDNGNSIEDLVDGNTYLVTFNTGTTGYQQVIVNKNFTLDGESFTNATLHYRLYSPVVKFFVTSNTSNPSVSNIIYAGTNSFVLTYASNLLNLESFTDYTFSALPTSMNPISSGTLSSETTEQVFVRNLTYFKDFPLTQPLYNWCVNNLMNGTSNQGFDIAFSYTIYALFLLIVYLLVGALFFVIKFAIKCIDTPFNNLGR